MWMTTEVTGLHRARSRYGWMVRGLCLVLGLRPGACDRGGCGGGDGCGDGGGGVPANAADADDRVNDTSDKRTFDNIDVGADGPLVLPAVRICLLKTFAEPEAPPLVGSQVQGFLPMQTAVASCNKTLQAVSSTVSTPRSLL